MPVPVCFPDHTLVWGSLKIQGTVVAQSEVGHLPGWTLLVLPSRVQWTRLTDQPFHCADESFKEPSATLAFPKSCNWIDDVTN